MLDIYVLTAFDFYRQKHYTSRFYEYDDAERTARFLMQKDPNVWAVKIHKQEWGPVEKTALKRVHSRTFEQLFESNERGE